MPSQKAKSAKKKSEKTPEVEKVEESVKTTLVKENTSVSVTEIDTSSVETLPYVTFYSKKGNKAQEIKMDIEGVIEAQPVLFYEDEYFSLANVPLQICAEDIFWGIRSKKEPYDLMEIRLDEPSSWEDRTACETELTSKWEDHILVHGLAFIDEFEYPIAFCCIFRGVKADWILRHLNVVNRTEKPRWAKKNKLNEKLKQLEPRKRIVSTLKMLKKTGKRGDYFRADAICMSTPETVVAKLAQLDPEKTEHPDGVALFNKTAKRFEDRQRRHQRFLPNSKGIIPATGKPCWVEEDDD